MRMTVDGLSQGYGKKTVIKDIAFETGSGELLSILGPNGCGKSTLIKTLCNVMKPREGTIAIDGEDTRKMDPGELAKLISYVPQSLSNFGYSTVYDLVLIGRRPYVEWSYSKEDLRIAAEAMIAMKVDDYADRDLRELSGGQRQRAYVARSLAQKPEFYIFDEPTSSFDLRNQLDTMRIMKDIVDGTGSCLIVALHDLNLAIRYSDRVLVLDDQRIYDLGKPEEVITPEMILDVYGVTADVVEDGHGLYVRPYDSAGDAVADRA